MRKGPKEGAGDALFNDATYYAYDANGSLLRQQDTAPATAGDTYFEYNAVAMVDRIIWKDESTTRFFYDGNLQRYAMDEDGTVSYFLWDGLNIVQELDDTYTVVDEHTNAETAIDGIGQLVETLRPYLLGRRSPDPCNLGNAHHQVVRFSTIS